MFYNYTGLQEYIKVEIDAEYEENVFTLSLHFENSEIHGITVDFNKGAVCFDADHTVYELGYFCIYSLEFMRNKSFFEILFLQVI